MKKTTYTIKLLSSLVISPRAGQALYKEIDEFCLLPNAEIPDSKSNNKQEVKVVYPFYQYGEYKKYDPEHASYYIPGSSMKGALRQHKMDGIYLMVDDVTVPNSEVALRILWKAQYLEEEEKAKFAPFLDNVGIEMIKDGMKLEGELYLEESIEFSTILKLANKNTKDKINQMCEYLQLLLTRNYKDKELKQNLCAIKENLSSLLNENNVILLGGYKGLLHSILLENNYNRSELNGGLFIDSKTLLPHGLVKIKPIIHM